ncbi:MAG: ABC transporter permease subunit [Vicinamibacterales bacterium]
MTGAIGICARQELMLAVRSRWTQIFAVVFAVLAVLVASAGYVLSGGAGVQDFSRSGASLVQLVLLLVPLTSLVIGVMALVPERGAAELLYSQPVARGAILVGKLLGLFEALVTAQLLGFGAAGLVIFNQAGDEGLGGFFLVIGGSAALTGVFLSLAALIAVGSVGRRTRALAVALVVWFVAVVLVDVAALGVASWLPSGSASRLLMSTVLANPVDVVRTGVLLGLEGTAAFGAASLAFFRFTGGAVGSAWWLGGSLLLWLTIPTILAVRRLTRADI